MKPHLLPSFLALLCATSAMAAEYYVVVPVKGRTTTAPAESIAVSLQAATLPAAMVGQAYSYNLRDHLLVTGDKALDLNQATLTTADALPAGLSLAANGVLSGTPTLKNEAGASFQVVANYKTQTGQQAYTIVVNGAVLRVKQISVGAAHVCAITLEGGAKCWGSNTYGQLGDGTTTSKATPTDVSGLQSGVTFISANKGNHSTCAVQNGAAKCWGANGNGQLGDNSKATRLSPVTPVGLSSNVTSVTSSTFHTCALTTAGGVKCWGNNNLGQLGDNTLAERLVPVSVNGMASVVSQISAGTYHTCALTTSGLIKCWGKNSAGELGDNTETNRTVPTDVYSYGLTALKISAGDSHTCALYTGGQAACWGQNVYKQLGSGGSTSFEKKPMNVKYLTSGVADISAGMVSTCAVTSAGAAKCWGRNNFGQIGIGNTTNQPTAVDVSGLNENVLNISAGSSTACAVTTTGVKCWGDNSSGQLGSGATSLTPSLTPVDVQP